MDARRPASDDPLGGEPAPRLYRQGRYRPPSGSTEILLVRHGASAAFAPGAPHPTLDGCGDPELAAEGREQAARLADRLALERIDAIFVSTLCRTLQTAEPLAERLGLVPVADPDLREVFLGEWEAGLFRQRMAERDPIAIELIKQQRWDAIPGAESNESLVARVSAAIERIAALHPDGRVLAVAHAGVIGTILSVATGAQPFAFVSVDNASISVLVVTRRDWRLRLFNDTTHLHGLDEEWTDFIEDEIVEPRAAEPVRSAGAERDGPGELDRLEQPAVVGDE